MYCKEGPHILIKGITFVLVGVVLLPWVPEGIVSDRQRPTHDKGHYKDLTETGNLARKVFGTKGIVFPVPSLERIPLLYKGIYK